MDDPEVDGRVLLTFYPDNVPVHYSISIFDLRMLLDEAKAAIKMDDHKHILTGNNHGN